MQFFCKRSKKMLRPIRDQDGHLEMITKSNNTSYKLLEGNIFDNSAVFLEKKSNIFLSIRGQDNYLGFLIGSERFVQVSMSNNLVAGSYKMHWWCNG
jgi:hypothetical protein